MVITLIIVGGLVAMTYCIVNGIRVMVANDLIAKAERVAAANDLLVVKAEREAAAYEQRNR